MHIRNLIAVSATALIASSGASLAQETMTDGLVMVNVAGSMVPVPVSIAAQACGMDAAAVIEAADMANTDAKGADMVAADPAAEATAGAGEAADEATGEATTEAAVGTGAGTTETDTGEVSEAATGTADAGLTAETATGGDQPADAGADASADAVAVAGADEGMPTAVCEIDEATAGQYGIPTASEASGG